MSNPLYPTDEQDAGELRRHYQVETELSNRLRAASREDRRRLYGELYQTFYAEFPHLKQRTEEEQQAKVNLQYLRLRPYLNPDSVFVEIGAGDGELSRRVASSVRQVYTLEVTDEILGACTLPENMEFKLFDGFKIPMSDDQVDVAYSNQLMEHLHPDDALEQLQETCRILKPGGAFICITPNRLTGPHDASRFVDDLEPKGFHLKEYTNWNLAALMRKAGFTRVYVLLSAGGRGWRLPLIPVGCVEAVLGLLPHRWARSIALRTPLGGLLGIKMIAFKSGRSGAEETSCDA